ncbi:MAG: hypothetical protein E7310_08820 [Clostridiales bacterium]|nr:hypothetical protein [Clostridiales bacterium]
MNKDLDYFDDELTEEEKKYYKNKYSKLRKVSILKNLPYEEWSKEELLDLIEEHDFYMMIQNSKNKTRYFSISDFATNGEYERYSLFEEYRKLNLIKTK